MLRSIIFVLFSLFLIPAMAAPVNINTANAQQIADSLTGVGMVKAEAIVNYRKEHGKFKAVDDLTLVKGIGEKTVEKNRSDILLKNKE